MKKFLSLVLALVMTMSLVTVSAGAADFTDDSSITYEEAVDVMTALGVVGGYSDGSFGPKGTLTRGAAAKIICNLILGTTASEALVADAAPYSDVPTSNVFAGYIAYLAKEGVVGGYADGTFRPAATLTGYAFMKMLLGVIGLDASVEGYTGNNWSIAVAKRALSEDVDLTKGLKGDFNGTKTVTREEACLYAFNAIKACKFSYPTSSTIIVGDVTVKNNSVATQSNTKYYTDVFPKLSATTTFDDLGHPATKWVYKNETVGTYANAADETYVLTSTYEIGAGKDYASLLDVLKDEDFTDNSDLFYSTLSYQGKRVFVNGEGYSSSATEVENAMMNAKKGGVTVELYYNDDDNDAIDYVTILNYSINEIEDVSTKLTKAQKEDGATSKIQVNGTWYMNNDVVGFDEDTYVEDAYLLYIKKDGKQEIIASQIAEVVEGEVTSVKGSDQATIAGTTYKYVSGVSIDVEDEGSFYLNVAGQIAAVDTDSSSDNYAFVYKIIKNTDTNSDGNEAVAFTAYYVAADGTKGSADIAYDYTDGKYYYDGTTTEISESFNGVMAYSVNSDGEFVRETAKDKIETETMTVNKNKAAGTDSDTKFVFAWTKSSGKVGTSVATGYKNVSIASKTVYTVTNTDGDYLYVFVGFENGTVGSDVKYGVVLDETPDVTKNADGNKVYTYSVVVDGEETTISHEKTALTALSNKGVAFKYTLDGEYVDTCTALTFAKVESARKGNYVTVGGTQYDLESDVEAIYTVTLEYETKADYESAITNESALDTTIDLESVAVSEGASVDNDSWVAYVVDGADLDVLFVVDFVY